jgi:hypothetical protein
MKKKKDGFSYKRMSEACDRALERRGAPKLTFAKGVTVSGRAAAARQAKREGKG